MSLARGATPSIAMKRCLRGFAIWWGGVRGRQRGVDETGRQAAGMTRRQAGKEARSQRGKRNTTCVLK